MELGKVAFVRFVLALPIAACLALLILAGDVVARVVLVAGLVVLFFLHEALTISALDSIKDLKFPRSQKKSGLASSPLARGKQN